MACSASLVKANSISLLLTSYVPPVATHVKPNPINAAREDAFDFIRINWIEFDLYFRLPAAVCFHDTCAKDDV